MNKRSIYMVVKDHSVSGEAFELVKNPEYGFLETTPLPPLDKLPYYYKSDDYISHTDAKRNLFEKAYHLARMVSLRKKIRLINSFASESKNLLDVGCGTGDFLQTAIQNDWHVTGIEPNEDARAIANSKTKHVVFDTEQMLKFNANHFDVITLWHVLEHVPELEEHLTILQTLLKPNGVLIIAVPNYKSYDAAYYKNHWAAFDVPRHLWHFSRSSISKLVSKKNMRIIKTKPMFFDAFYVSLLSEKYKTGTMNPIRGFLIGMLSNLKSIITKETSSITYIIKNV